MKWIVLIIIGVILSGCISSEQPREGKLLGEISDFGEINSSGFPISRTSCTIELTNGEKFVENGFSPGSICFKLKRGLKLYENSNEEYYLKN